MKYTIKPVVCDYSVICTDTGKVMCVCNIKRNAELIADILNCDDDVYVYPHTGSSSEKPRLIDPAYEKTLNKWIGAEVLDRIRNEMHATAEKHEDGVYYLRDEWVDEIIDKYAEEGKA